jgi:hypothetical protein
MTSASSLAYPGSRTLATWWRQLAPLRPQGLWVGYLFLHHVEALARWREPRALEPLLLLVLEAIALEQQEPVPTGPLCRRLEQRLSLTGPVVCRLVRSLAQGRLLMSQNAGSSQEQNWRLTEEGLAALRLRQVWINLEQRATFPFLERLKPDGQRLAAPHYVRIDETGSASWASERHPFDISLLPACVEQGPVWKKTFGFPFEVTAFGDHAPAPDARGGWDNVVVDRTERLLAALVQGPPPEEKLVAFGVKPEGWGLQTSKAIAHLPAAAGAIFWGPDDTLDLLRRAWLSWCAVRNVPPGQAEACSFALLHERLIVSAPEPLIQFLRLGRSDIFKGDAWLLVGEGYLRQAVRLELAPLR